MTTNSEPSTALVSTPSGNLIGAVQGGVSCFHAVPYAQPPTQERRFSAPLKALPWGGVRTATAPGPVSLQRPSRLRRVMGDFERTQSEDCLTVTVWTPSTASAGRPVLVWLHGGAFITGGGDLPWYDGARLAREGDIVVVAVNYRLGALGYLALEGVSPGNLAILDQALALEWVQSHIGAFGGDPSQVTLMGQSAGAQSVAYLLARPGYKPPVQRAIMLSAPLGVEPFPAEAAAQVGRAYLQALGIEPGALDALARLQRVPESALLPAQDQATQFYFEHLAPPGSAMPPFSPVSDGGVVAPRDWRVALRAAAARVDMLLGTTADEGTAFVPGPEPAQRAMTEQVFEAATLSWGRAAADAGRDAFLYQFDWAPDGSPLRATHCIELPFVFGSAATFGAAPMLAGSVPAEVEALSAQLRAAWIAFIRSGQPAAPELPNWPAYAHGSPLRMHVNVRSQVRAV